VVWHLNAYIHKHWTISIITQVQFFKQKLQTLQFFMDQNCKPFIVQFFVNQNCKPFIMQFFWQKLQTFQWHTTTQALHTPKRPIELWWQLQNQLFTFIVFFCYSLLHITWCGTLVNTHLRTNISSFHQKSHMLWNKHLTQCQQIFLNYSYY